MSDFDFPTQTDPKYGWATRGIPDLIEIELQQRGFATLDRSTIANVIREQRRAHDGILSPDSLRTCGLLGAEYVVVGMFEQTTDGLLLRARLLRVSSAELVASASVRLPQVDALPNMITSITQSLIKDLGTSNKAGRKNTDDSQSYPEALLMFHRGLDAYSLGVPEIAVALFSKAHGMDSRMRLAKLWEVKMYEAMGESRRANIALDELALDRSMDARTNFVANVWTVLEPLVVAPEKWPDIDSTKREIRTQVEMALTKHPRVRVYDAHRMPLVLQEKDLRLSGLFEHSFEQRYATWLLSSVALQVVFQPGSKEDGSLALSTVDLINGARIASSNIPDYRPGDAAVVANSISQLVEETISASKGGMHIARTRPHGSDTFEEISGMVNGGYLALARALKHSRDSPDNFQIYRTLADCFANLGQIRQAAVAVGQCIGSLRLEKERAELDYYGVHRWLHNSGPYAFRLGPSLKHVDPTLLARLESDIIEHFPNTLAAACLHYHRAFNHWMNKSYAEAARHAERCLSTLKRESAQVKISEVKPALRFSALYIEGASRARLGASVAARQLLTEAREVAVSNRISTIMIGPAIGMRGNRPYIDAYGGNSMKLPDAVDEELQFLNSYPEVTPAHRALRNTDPSDSKYNQLFCIVTAERWEKNGPSGHENMNGIRNALSSVFYNQSVEIARSLMARLCDAYAGKQVLVRAKRNPLLSDDELIAAAPALLHLPPAVEQTGKFIDLYDSLFEPRKPPKLGIKALEIVPYKREEFRQKLSELTRRVPGKEQGVPAIIWVRLARLQMEDEDYSASLKSYHQAARSDDQAGSREGLELAIIRAGLDRGIALARKTIKSLCKEFDYVSDYPVWPAWFMEGVRFRDKGQRAEAILCFEYLHDFFSEPESVDSYFRTGQVERYGRVLLTRDNKRWDYLWGTRYKFRKSSIDFHLAKLYAAAGQREKAAPLLRELAEQLGGESIGPMTRVHSVSGNSWTSRAGKIGIEAAKLLERLHAENERGGGPGI